MKVAVYFATGFEEVEALSVVDVLRRGNIEVIMVGVDGSTVVGSHKIGINMDKQINEVDHNEIDMIVLPGGMPGMTNLLASEAVQKNVKEFKAQNKWLAAICAAPSILGKLGLLEGEKATCYPSFEKNLIGCEHTGARLEVSHKIVTAKGPGVALDFGLKLLEILTNKELSEQIRKAMIAD